MRMNYRQKNDRQRRGARNFVPFAVVAFIFGLIFLVRFIFPNFFPRVFEVIALPIWNARRSVLDVGGNLHTIFQSKNGLVTENSRLKDELESYRNSQLDLERLRRENEMLRQIIGKGGNARGILAEVLVKPPQSSYDSIILDVGSRDGVFIGNTITVPPNIALGKISEIGFKTSKATLFSTAGNMVYTLIDNSNISVTITGKSGGNFEVELPREVPINRGDILVSSEIPRSIIGTIEDIQFDATDALQRILIKSPVNISELRFVEIHQ